MKSVKFLGITALAIILFLGLGATAYAGGDGSNVIPPLPKVDAKVNGYDGPLTVIEDSILVISWSSEGARECNAFGSFVPLVNPLTAPNSALLTSELNNFSTNGRFEVYARHINPSVRQLFIGIQCFGPYYPTGINTSRADSTTDTVTVQLLDQTTALQQNIANLQVSLRDITAERDNAATSLADAIAERDRTVTALTDQISKLKSKQNGLVMALFIIVTIFVITFIITIAKNSQKKHKNIRYRNTIRG